MDTVAKAEEDSAAETHQSFSRELAAAPAQRHFVDIANELASSLLLNILINTA